jgi:hypothetical protein
MGEKTVLSVVDRRVIVKAGGAALAALAGLRGAMPTLAQDASPVASPAAGMLGRYAVARIRTVKPDQDASALIADVRSQFVPIVSAIPGYVLYLNLYNDQTRTQTAFGIFADKAGADASTAKGAAFATAHATYYVNPTPQVVDGSIAVFDGAGMSASTKVEGSYGVFRIRTIKPDQDANALLADIRSQFVPVVSAIKGYVTYMSFYNDQSRIQTSFGIFADKAGADESTAKGAAFATAHATYYVNPTPQVVDGSVVLFNAAAM